MRKAVTNSYDKLWRLFGTSNQMIASISLVVIAAYFLSRKKKINFIIIPASFVLITTLTAMLYLTFNPNGYLSTGNYTLATISMAMSIFGVVVAWEGFKVFRKNTS